MKEHIYDFIFCSLQFNSIAQSCLTLCDPMNCSMPGLPVHHQLPEFTQTHVHQVSDAIQPSHPQSSPSPPAPNPSQHQSFPMSQLCMRWPKYWSFSFSISHILWAIHNSEGLILLQSVEPKSSLGKNESSVWVQRGCRISTTIFKSHIHPL